LRRADAEREGRRRERTVDGDGVAAARQAGEFADVLTLVSVIAMVAAQAPDRIVLGDWLLGRGMEGLVRQSPTARKR
jgi:hypothetical protein